MIGENIKNYRKAKKFRQKELAEAAGISTRTLQRFESGERSADVETIQRIADVLFVDVTQLLWDENDFYYLDTLKKAGISRVEGFANMMDIGYDRCLALLSGAEAPTEQEREKLQLIAGLSFEEFLAPIERDYGTPTDAEIFPWQNTLKESLIAAFDQLNAQGQEKAIESVELLTKVPEYRK